jgi:alkylated DNA repair dioxygenase AlkB
VMCGSTQQFWQHGINKTKRQIDDRINLTFRHIFKDY